MTTQHTPGPWIYENRNGDNPKNTCNGWGTVGLWGADNSLILGSGQGWDAEFQEPEEANARLIAAAPELLEACQGLLHWAGRYVAPNEKEAFKEWHAVVVAAITKAGGTVQEERVE